MARKCVGCFLAIAQFLQRQLKRSREHSSSPVDVGLPSVSEEGSEVGAEFGSENGTGVANVLFSLTVSYKNGIVKHRTSLFFLPEGAKLVCHIEVRFGN